MNKYFKSNKLKSILIFSIIIAITSCNQKKEKTEPMETNNILLEEWAGPYEGTPAFDKMNIKDVKSALEKSMAEKLNEIDAITKNTEAPTFENTIVAMEKSGKTLDRVFLAIKAQFKNIEYDVKSYFFTRTENQVSKIMDEAKKNDNAIILYTIVDTSLAKFLANKGDEKKIPCFSVLGNLIMNFSKLLNQKASHVPSGQHALNEEYYERIEAIQFTMAHDDGNLVEDIGEADLILLGVSRTSKTPTSIYLANRGYKTVNVPLVLDQKIPDGLVTNNKSCIVGLIADPERLADIRRNRVAIMNDLSLKEYTNLDSIRSEVENSKKLFKKNNWPIIDVTRRSVEETAASILKIIET